MSMVVYQPAPIATAPAPAPSAPSAPAPAAAPSSGGGTNWRAFAFLAIIALIVVTLFRLRAPGSNTPAARLVWSAILAGLLISFLTDLNGALGASVGFAIVLFMAIKNQATLTALLPKSSQASGSSSSSGGAGGAPPSSSTPPAVGGGPSGTNPNQLTPGQAFAQPPNYVVD